MNNKNSISIGFSCYNETKFVISNIKKIEAIAKKEKINYEILVIDDASTEDGIINLINFCKKNKILYLRHKINLGFFKTFLTGLINSKKKYYKLFAGDDATDKKHISKIFQEFDQQDILIPYNKQFEVTGKPFLRKVTSIFYTKLVNLVSGLNLKYYNGLPVFLKKKALMNLSDASGYGWQAELLVNCIYSGCSFREIYTRNKEIKFVYNSIKLQNIPSVLFSIIRIFFKKLSPGRIKRIKDNIKKKKFRKFKK